MKPPHAIGALKNVLETKKWPKNFCKVFQNLLQNFENGGAACRPHHVGLPSALVLLFPFRPNFLGLSLLFFRYWGSQRVEGGEHSESGDSQLLDRRAQVGVQ